MSTVTSTYEPIKHNGVVTYGTISPYTSTNTLTSFGTVEVAQYSEVFFYVDVITNDVRIQLSGNFDGSTNFPIVAVGSANVVAPGTAMVSITQPMNRVVIEAQSNVDDSHGVVQNIQFIAR